MVEKDCINTSQSTTGESSNMTIGDYQDSNFCWHRLPCGLCRLTGMQCPKAAGGQTYPYSPITWTSTNVSMNPNVAVQPDGCTGQFTNEQMNQMTTAAGKYDPNLKAMN